MLDVKELLRTAARLRAETEVRAHYATEIAGAGTFTVDRIDRWPGLPVQRVAAPRSPQVCLNAPSSPRFRYRPSRFSHIVDALAAALQAVPS